MMMPRQALAVVLLIMPLAGGLRADEAEDRAVQAIKKLGVKLKRDETGRV
jgi:hypothetical protein